MTDNPSLIFLHIPKTAGSTLRSILVRHFKRDEIFRVYPSFAVQARLDQFAEMGTDAQSKIRCVIGHLPFGFHAYLKADATYVTMLRNPVEQFISHYYFERSNPEHRYYKLIAEKYPTIEDYAHFHYEERGLTNMQTRLVSGYYGLAEFDKDQFQPLPSAALELAKQNMASHFSITGVTEYFDQSLLLLQAMLGGNRYFYVKRNVTAGAPSKPEISQKARTIVENHSACDLELYEFARASLIDRFQALEGAQGKLARFQTLNQLYSVAQRSFTALPSQLQNRLSGWLLTRS